MTMPLCFECQLPVLGLRGQDTMLDTFYLGSAERDLLDANAYGEVHLLCLATSPWVDRWVAAIRRNFEQVRRFVLLGSGPCWVYRIPTTKQIIVVYPTGRVEFLEPDAIRAIEGGSSRIDVSVVRMVEFDAPIRARVAALDGGERMSWLLDELGVRDRLLEPDPVDRGTFRVVGQDTRGVELRLEYAVEFGRDVAAQVLALIRP